VKLIAAEGCLLGLSNCVPLLAFTAIAGGALGVLMALRHGRLRQTAGNVLSLATHHRQHGLAPHPELNVLNTEALRLPYALAIAAGTALTVWMQMAQVPA
jgi:prepilin peptidase CpaA